MAEKAPAAAVKPFAWHATSVADVLSKLQTSPETGLTEEEAARRLATDGPNSLTPPEKPGFFKRLWGQVNNALVWILIIAAIISGALLEWAEFGLILGVVTVNVTIGMVQESNAEKAAEALKAMLAPRCTVIRDGQRKMVDAVGLVPGDVVFVQSGDRIPADLRMASATNLKILEAMLTGEANPVQKITTPLPEISALGDRKNMAFSATLVMSGQGIGIVAATGDNAEIGRINALVAGEEDKPTQLQIQLEIFGRWVSICTCIIGIAAFLLAWLRTHSALDEAFRAAVAIAVAIIPEGLPAVVTISMALGVSAMAAHKAIIRQLPAVETLGSVTVICSDKTGTLTKNEMTAVGMHTRTGYYKATGAGYDPTGTITTDADAPITADKMNQLRTMLMTGLLANDGGLSKKDNGLWTVSGDPTDVAPLVMARKAGVPDHVVAQAAQPKLHAIPFESDHKWMATLHTDIEAPAAADGSKPRVVHVKGAPERLFALCKDQVEGDDVYGATAPLDVPFWQEAAAAASKKGLRVLAFCRYSPPKEWDSEAEMTVPAFTAHEPFLTLECLVAIMDPPRTECIAAIKECHTAGIVVKMITGDHPSTARAIGSMLGLTAADGEVHTGPEIDAYTDAEFKDIALRCNVFARVSPENKIRVVKTLEAAGQIASMTGDGVNDAPALKAASIGVAMGITGTDVSKEASKMVLADDNFASIVAAVKEGRRLWDNLRKIMLFNLPANFAQGLCVFFAFVLGMEHPPLTPIQVLYVNMIMSITLGLAIALEPAEADVMSRPPRRPSKPLVGKLILWRTFWVTGVIVVLILGNFHWSLDMGYSLERSRSVAFNVLVFSSMLYALNCRKVTGSVLNKDGFVGNLAFWWCQLLLAGLQVLITYAPGIQDFFSMGDMGGEEWARTFGFSIALFLVVEAEKWAAPRYLTPCVRPILRRLGNMVPAWLCAPKTPEQASAMSFIATSASTSGLGGGHSTRRLSTTGRRASVKGGEVELVAVVAEGDKPAPVPACSPAGVALSEASSAPSASEAGSPSKDASASVEKVESPAENLKVEVTVA